MDLRGPNPHLILVVDPPDFKLRHLRQATKPEDSDIFRAAANSYNNLVADIEGYSCAICSAVGHTSDDCPVLAALKSSVAHDAARKKFLAHVLSDFRASRRLPLN